MREPDRRADGIGSACSTSADRRGGWRRSTSRAICSIRSRAPLITTAMPSVVRYSPRSCLSNARPRPAGVARSRSPSSHHAGSGRRGRVVPTVSSGARVRSGSGGATHRTSSRLDRNALRPRRRKRGRTYRSVPVGGPVCRACAWRLLNVDDDADVRRHLVYERRFFARCSKRSFRCLPASRALGEFRPYELPQCFQRHAARVPYVHPRDFASIHQVVELGAANGKSLGRFLWSQQQSLYSRAILTRSVLVVFWSVRHSLRSFGRRTLDFVQKERSDPRPLSCPFGSRRCGG